MLGQWSLDCLGGAPEEVEAEEGAEDHWEVPDRLGDRLRVVEVEEEAKVQSVDPLADLEVVGVGEDKTVQADRLVDHFYQMEVEEVVVAVDLQHLLADLAAPLVDQSDKHLALAEHLLEHLGQAMEEVVGEHQDLQ